MEYYHIEMDKHEEKCGHIKELIHYIMENFILIALLLMRTDISAGSTAV